MQHEKKETDRANPFNSFDTHETSNGSFGYYRLSALADAGLGDIERLPYSIRILLEAVLRNVDGKRITEDHVKALARWDSESIGKVAIPFKPARVILQDFTGVPALVDLAAMRSAMHDMGGDPARINPLSPVDLVVDHSVQVDVYGTDDALEINAKKEFERNRERYLFLRWGQKAFENLSMVPPASGIVHQVNLEHIAEGVRAEERDGQTIAFPDTLVGTDSHTPMINGLGVLGWGVGGIEAEAVMLGEPIDMLVPDVVGVRVSGSLRPGVTATDLVLRVTEMLRKKGVVDKFVEFYGPGLSSLSLPDRATIGNMAPEYGATVGYFPVDAVTLDYLNLSGRPAQIVERVEAYCRAQGLFRTDDSPEPKYHDSVDLDLSSVKTSLAGPKRPQDRIELGDMKKAWRAFLKESGKEGESKQNGDIQNGSVAISAITSCTNTSNPSVMLAAGLLAKKAVDRGLSVPQYVKTSLAPGSKVVTDYLTRTDLMEPLEKLGYNLVGYGCTTCIGNSGPLRDDIAAKIDDDDLLVAAVLSGNRNFEGRIHPQVKASYLCSPALVVAYGLAGTVDIDMENEPLGTGKDGKPVYLADVWPSDEEVRDTVAEAVHAEQFSSTYAGIEESNPVWNALPVGEGAMYEWDEDSTYIQRPPFFEGMSAEAKPLKSIEGARTLVMVGDSITTDHISPAGAIDPESPAGLYLKEKGVEPKDFNTYGSRRGNDRVMTRGTFANVRLKNKLAPGTEGSWTTHFPSGDVVSIYDAAMRYRDDKVPTVVVGGEDYGMGSSRDWAAKGADLLGVRAVLAISFERIHRSNLVGMGILPLTFGDGDTPESLGLTGRETFTIHLDDSLSPGQMLDVDIVDENGKSSQIRVRCNVTTEAEVETLRHGGILKKVLRRMLAT